MSLDADAIIDMLGLRPHPEGGWYHETWRPAADDGARPASTAIYYLLRAGESSHWHRVDATETWHFYAGDPLELRLAAAADQQVETRILGSNLICSSPTS